MTLVPSFANPRNLRNLIILTHGISISEDGQAVWCGATQIGDCIEVVAVELSMAPHFMVGASDLIQAASALIVGAAALLPFLLSCHRLSLCWIWGSVS